MQVKFEYSEIQSLIKAKTGWDISLSAIDEQTVKAEAKVSVKVPFLGEIKKNIGVNVSVEKIEGNDVLLKYDGGMGTDMIIGGLLSFLSLKVAMKMVEETQGNGIVMHLAEIDKARKLLDVVELTDIVFMNDAVTVEGKIKDY